MPVVPQDFFCRLDTGSGGIEPRPREMSWLTATSDRRKAAGIDLRDVTRTERLIVLAQLVRTIALLHRHGWVFGDISSKNVVFKIDPPLIMLLDCDSAAPLSDLSRRQPSTPFWLPPELSGQPPSQSLQDDATDVYKLGLAIVRCLLPGPGATTTSYPGRLAGQLDAEGIGLVTRALSDDRSERPSARELYDYLDRAVSARPRRAAGTSAPRADSPAAPFPVKVFLCHSSSDKRVVRELRSRLLSDDIQPWLDEEDILPGQDWDLAIRKAIRESDIVLVCLSKASISKVGYIQREIRHVLDVADEQPEGTIFLIPVRLEPCEVPDRLRRWQWVDLFEERGYQRLLRALQGHGRARQLSSAPRRQGRRGALGRRGNGPGASAGRMGPARSSGGHGERTSLDN